MRKTVADGPGVSSQVIRIRRLEGGGVWGKVRSLCPRISSTRFQRSIVNRISRYVRRGGENVVGQRRQDELM